MGKRITTILIQVVIAVVIIELLLRIIYFQKNANDPIAFISAYKSLSFRANDDYTERLLSYHNRIRPDSAHVNKEIVEEVIKSNSFEYTPWVDYKNIDFSGKYVNTKGFIRKSVPDKVTNADKPKPLKIYLFGGSTMFGFNVMDNETIASALGNVYKEDCSDCPSIEIYNYGIPAYYSYNELILLNHLIYSGNKPDIAIFLDGLNEFVIVQAARQRVPWFYYRLKENIKNVKDSTLSLFQLKPGESISSTSKEAATNYLSNITYASQLCNDNNISPLFFIQPTPYYKYPNKKNDPIVDTSSNELLATGYKLLESECDTTRKIYFLGNVLENEKGLPFIDQFHYSPSMNRRIAEEIYERLIPVLNK